MPTNPYFNNYSSTTEQSLVESLIIECIKQYGIDLLYIPREAVKPDGIYGEDVLSSFTQVYEVECYIKNVEGFAGEGTFLSKLGALEIRDQATFVVARTRFDDAVDGNLTRPREGDLLYFPLSRGLFEIKFVEHRNPFYQLGRLYVYEMRAELFEYSHQKLETGQGEIDVVEDTFGYSVVLRMGLGGPGKYATGETVYQGSSLANATAKAKVVTHDLDTGLVTVNRLAGAFLVGSILHGNSSGLSYDVAEVDYLSMPSDPISDNKGIENEAQEVVDFSEKDPFSGQ